MLVVINPKSSRTRRAWIWIEDALETNAITHDAKHTETVGQAEFLVREALEQGHETIAVVGGDGTLSEAVRGFFKTKEGLPHQINPAASLAILPGGTGNDFARGLTGGRASLDTWVKRLVHHQQRRENRVSTRVIDTIHATVDGGTKAFVCLNASTIGISANVAARVSMHTGRISRLPGEARFALEAIRALKSWRNQGVRLTVDEDVTTCDTNLIVVANGAFVGGGMKVAPMAQPDDGRLEALTACNLSRGEVIRGFPRLYRGRHLGLKKLVMRSGCQITVETVDATPLPLEADGDVRGFTPAVFRIMPASLRIVW